MWARRVWPHCGGGFGVGTRAGVLNKLHSAKQSWPSPRGSLGCYLGLPDALVPGYLALTLRGWSQRAGMLFEGAMHGADSPNYDSLCWFVDAVQRIERQRSATRAVLPPRNRGTGTVPAPSVRQLP